MLVNPLTTDNICMCHESFSVRMSLLVIPLENRFRVSRKGGIGGGRWVHPKGGNSMATSGPGCEKSLVEDRQAISFQLEQISIASPVKLENEN